MRRVTYKSVIDRIAGYLGEADGLSVEEAALANAKINFFVRLAWEHFWFPDFMTVERRTFRPAYDEATNYASATELFFNGDSQYYQSLIPVFQSVDSHPPATLSGGQYTVDDNFWALSQGSYSGNDFDDTVDYTLGDIVRNPTDGQFYQRLSGLVASAAGESTANANIYYAGLAPTKPLYVYSNGITAAFWSSGLAQWIYYLPNGNQAYTSSEDVATPDLVVTWTPGGGITAPGPTIATTGTPGEDAAIWGLLTPFIRSIDYEQTGETAIGEVRFLWTANPETTNRAQRVGGSRGPDFRMRTDFLQVLGCANVVWAEFRIRPNVYTGGTRDDSTGYSTGAEKYDTETGDYWIALANIAAGQSPTTNPEKWERVDFPYVLAEFVAQSAYAMLTNKDQQIPEDFSIQMAAGYPLLQAEMDKIERQQGQTRQLNVVNGRSC